MSDVALFVLAREPRGAKSRLAPALDENKRADLARTMLGEVLTAARGVALARRVVVTESATVRELARSFGAETLDVPLSDTNGAAVAAVRAASKFGDKAALILAADLPLLRASDIEALLTASRGADVVIGPDRRMRGTNALLLRPPDRIAPAFGDDSLRTHQDRARAAGATVALVTTRGVTTDIDEPEDLLALT